MARVFFSNALRRYTDGVPEVEIEASTVRELFGALASRFPELAPRLRAGIAISIDGEIVNDPMLESVGPGSEIHFLPPIAGG